MSISITGIYQNGQIKLDTIPLGIERARVTVEFEELPETHERKKFIMQFGMLATPGARQSIWEDFQEVKKQWNPKEH